MQIGFIGFGEAAYCISSGLKGEGLSDIIAFDSMANHETIGKVIASRALEAGVTLVKEARIVGEQSDVLFVAVPSTFTLSSRLT